MAFTVADAVAAAGVGNPWERAQDLDGADPDAIVEMAGGFAAAAGHARTAMTLAGKADPVTAESYLVDRVSVYDAAAAGAATKQALGDGGEHPEQIARILTSVAGHLSRTQAGVRTAIAELDAQLRGISDNSAQLTAVSGSTDPAAVAAAERVLFDRAVAAIRAHGGRINTLIADYEGVLRSRTGSIASFGYAASPSDSDEGTGGGPVEPIPTVPGDGQPLRLDEMDRIRREYQVSDDPDGMRDWEPSGFTGWLADTFGDDFEPVHVTASEARLLDELGPFDLKALNSSHDDAFAEADRRFPSQAPDPRRNDDHNDAFRHAYWNALMTRNIGEDFAHDYGYAHERVRGNTPNREAMDLYNNTVGQRIAAYNPFASEEELADLVESAVRNGEMVVLYAEGNLVPSNQVQPDQTGHEPANAPGLPGKDPEWRTES
jgi:hypothetical protein